MASKKHFKTDTRTRRYRRFNDDFKRKKVGEIEQGKSSVTEISKAYEVSTPAIYKWIEKYSTMDRPERTIVESKSDTTKILALKKKIADLERVVGQKQVAIDFLEKVIDLAEDEYHVDIKKKFEKKP